MGWFRDLEKTKEDNPFVSVHCTRVLSTYDNAHEIW